MKAWVISPPRSARKPAHASSRPRGVPFADMTQRDVDKLQEEIEELFADLWQVPRFSGIRHGFRPNVDCFHTGDPHALTVVVELPGVDPQSVRVVAVSLDRKSTRLNSSHTIISYAVF